jgi:CRISPR/Cas system CSM-associated protein Csm3 (group 7 of RAMP superfamily)
MMFADRLVIEGELELLTDLHLGSGRVTERPPRADGEAGGEIGCVVRDHRGRAAIPGTSLKGALRAAAPAAGLGAGEITDLLGPARIAGALDAKLARFWLDVATRLGNDDGAAHKTLTEADGTRVDGFVRTRVRLAARTAAAETGFLFGEELVGKGTRFAFRATLHLLGPNLDPGHHDIVALGKLLHPLMRTEGLAIGAGARLGEGRVRLRGETLQVTLHTLDGGTGELRAATRPDLARVLCAATSSPSARSGRRWSMKLVGDGPFISMRENGKSPRPDQPQIVPLERDAGPVLWPSSLLGALRARAAWLVGREKLRNGARPWSATRAGAPIDDRSHVCPDCDHVAELSSIERLFGVAGWRGALAIAELRFVGPTNARHVAQSVSIDRLTGGARETALFATETFLDPVFEVTLAWRPRSDRLLTSEQREADAELLELLLGDLATTGVTLFLGHGAAKGFGWFGIQDVRET